MKKILILSVVTLITCCVFAQSPQKMSYQGVVRNSSNELVSDQAVGVKISILQGSASGIVVFAETYIPNPQTNINGLLSIEIGGGSVLTGTFSAIDWASGPYFLKTETDPTGGTNYTISGTSQLLSVPYAMHAKTAENGFSGSYSDLTNKPTLFSGNYNDLTNKPTLFDGMWSNITGKPTTIAGFGLTDAMNTSHAAYGITSGLISNWNTAYSWGNHTGLYRPIGYVPSWGEITGIPAGFADAVDNVDDSDNSITNELQALSISGSSLTLSQGGGTVVIPGDNWGNQIIVTNATLSGSGTTAAPLIIANNGVTSDKIANNAVTVAKLPAGASAVNYLRGDGTWAIPSAGSITETDPTWSGEANETVDIGRTGRVGIGTTSPSALLHTQGTGTGQGNVVFVGQLKDTNPGNPPVSGEGTRMMWYPDKSTFRAGYVGGSQWDAANIGFFSASTGYNNTASGDYSTAMGATTTASGEKSTAMGGGTNASAENSTAMGFETTASGISSTAMGAKTNASGDASTAIGYNNIASAETSTAMGATTTASGIASTAMGAGTNASGDYSTAMGIGTIASGEFSTALGMYNVGGGNPKEWIATDPLFEIGNGTSNTAHNNALTVLKNGNVGIGTSAPAGVLNISGDSDPTFPQLLLTENQNDYTRLMFKNTSAPTKNWTIAGRTFATDGYSYLNFYYDNGSIGQNFITITGNGDVGIGALPNYKLDVRGTIGNNTTLYHSDIRWKTDIKPIKYGINELMKLNSISYFWKANAYPEMGFDKGPQFGFIAQEFEKVIPELVRTDKDGYKSIDYVKLTPILVVAIQEQQKQIEELKALVNSLVANQTAQEDN